jgi:hypothetical protein
MLRRNSGRWSLVLLAGLALIFVPIASAANAERATQTLTLLALVSALAAVGVAWLALRHTGYVRSA